MEVLRGIVDFEDNIQRYALLREVKVLCLAESQFDST